MRGLMKASRESGTCVPPFSSLAAARLNLLNHPAPDRFLAVAEYGYSLRFIDPPLGVQWCSAAADALSADLVPSVRGRVLGYFANSHRVVGNYDDAKEVLERALKVLPGDPLLLEFKASLLRDIRHFDEAMECLREASEIRQASGDLAGFARTILVTAHVMDQAGESETAARLCLKALDFLDSSVDPSRNLLRAAVQNYATFMCNAGNALAALQALRTSEPILAGGEPFFQLRIEWLLGRIAARLRDESAERRLETVRQKLEEGGLYQEAALATLDLARYFVRRGDPRASAVALSVAPLLKSLGIDRDAREAELLSQISMADSNIDQLLAELYARIAWRTETRKVA